MPIWLFPLLKSKWLHYALFALALAGTWGWGKIGWRDAASWKLASQTQAKSYQAAQATATANAIAAKLAAEASSRAKAQEADNDYQTALAGARRAADVYRLRHSVTGPTSPAPAPADDHAAGLPQDTAAPAVVVSSIDFDICTENSVKLESAYAWAQTLNQAVPEPAFGK